MAGSVSNGAVVSPGSSPGVLTINGTYTQLPGGTLRVEIGGATPGTGYDQLKVTQGATLGGTLQISRINSFQPTPGQSFAVVVDLAIPVVGTFAAVAGTDDGNGGAFVAR